jgi:Ethanolamine utilization protein EutJ (predicted chaperonin)
MSPDQFDLVWEFQPLRLAFVSLVRRLTQQVNHQVGSSLSSSSASASPPSRLLSVGSLFVVNSATPLQAILST